MNTVQNIAILAGRILLVAIFIQSGWGKLGAPGPVQEYIASAGLPAPFLAYVVALVVEIGLGLAVLVGFQTRWAALGLALFTVAAALGFHFDFGDENQATHFMKNMSMAGGFLALFAFGGGAFSLDAMRGDNVRRQAVAA